MPKDTFPVPGIYGYNLQTPCYLDSLEDDTVSQITEYRLPLLLGHICPL